MGEVSLPNTLSKLKYCMQVSEILRYSNYNLFFIKKGITFYNQYIKWTKL